MTYEQIIFWSKFILFSIIILSTSIGGIISYKKLPPMKWGGALWIISTLIYIVLGLLIGLIISLLIRDHWFDIYNVVNPYTILTL